MNSEWLAERRLGITGTDAPGILDVDPWAGPYTVWARKLGLLPEASNADERLWWGSRLEALILERYAERTGRALVPPESWRELAGLAAVDVLAREHLGEVRRILARKDAPWQRCTLDGLCLGWAPLLEPGAPQEPQDGLGVVEAKTSSALAVGEWDRDGAPLRAQVQLQHNLAVAGASWGSLPVLGGDLRLRILDQAAHPAFQARLRAREERFWTDHILGRTPPAPGGGEAERRALSTIFPRPDGRTIVLPESFAATHKERELLRARADADDRRLREIDNAIRAAIGSAEAGQVRGTAITYTLELVEPRDRAPYRVLRARERRARRLA